MVTRETKYGYQEHPGRRYTSEERIAMQKVVVAAYNAGWSFYAAAALAGCGYSTARALFIAAGGRPRQRGTRGFKPAAQIIDANAEVRDEIRRGLIAKVAGR